MKLSDKIKWIIGISLVFMLIIVTNLVDRNNYQRVKDSMVTLYEDRLIVQDLIFEIAQIIHEKELALYTSDSTFFEIESPNSNKRLSELIRQIEETKLTNEEFAVLQELKINIEKLIATENQKVKLSSQLDNLTHKHFEIKHNLSDLDKIQLDEGRRQLAISKKAVESIELFTQIEIAILIVLALAVLLVIWYNPAKKKKKKKENQPEEL
jgi:hypothetical protein